MAGTGSGRTYSIKEVAALVGLPPSTLRYYEEVGVIPAIARDPSSGHRIYTEGDLELLTSVACLSASGMAIADMREFGLRVKMCVWLGVSRGDVSRVLWRVS